MKKNYFLQWKKKMELKAGKSGKSGKFFVVSQEEYRKMGEVHTRKDKMIRMQDVMEIEKQLNGH